MTSYTILPVPSTPLLESSQVSLETLWRLVGAVAPLSPLLGEPLFRSGDPVLEKGDFLIRKVSFPRSFFFPSLLLLTILTLCPFSLGPSETLPGILLKIPLSGSCVRQR